MIIKLLLIIALVLLYFFLSPSENGNKTYYYLTVVIYLVRELNVPYLGITVPGTVMAYVLFLGTLRNHKWHLQNWIGYIVCLVFSIIVGLTLSNNPDNTPDRVFGWASNLFIVMVLAIVPQSLFNSEHDLVVLARCVLGTCFVYSFSCIMGYYGFADGTVIYAGDVIDIDNFHASRSYGISSSNLVQTISVVSIPLIPWARFKKQWMEYALLIIYLYAAVITLKRMSFLAMIPSLLYYLYHLKSKNKNISLIIVVIIIVNIISVFWEPIMYRFEIAGFGGNEIDDSSTEARLGRNEMAKEAFLKSPIIGNGAGYFIYIHNGFYEILCNCGIIGIIGIFLKFIPSIKSVIHLNPWAYCQVVFLLTCFSLESAINHSQLMAFMGFYLAGYYFSRQYYWQLR